jgi:hypothetical protein
VTEWVPTVNSTLVILQLAEIVCEFTVVKVDVVQSTVEPDLNVTVPVGRVDPLPVTVALNTAVLSCPYTVDAPVMVSAVVVVTNAAGLNVSVAFADVDGL